MATWEKFAQFFGSYYTVFIAVVAHINLFLGCVTYAWPSPVLPKLFEPESNPLSEPVSTAQGDLIASIFYVGASLGPLILFPIVEKIGRRKVLMGLSFIPIVSYTILTFAKTTITYNVCRVFLGIWTGGIFSVEPVYVSEILSDAERPFLLSIITIFGFSGVFASVSIGPFISVPVLNATVACLSMVLSLTMVFAFPETPIDLMKLKGEKAARELLQRLRKGEIEEETARISESVSNESETSYFEIFKSFKNVKLICMATLPLLLQSYSGITLILNYSQLIFMETKMASLSEWCAIIVVGFTLSTTFLTPMFMNKKVSIYTLLYLSLCGAAICNLILATYFLFGVSNTYISWLPLIMLVLFVIIYNCGLDSIPWMLIGEFYPPNIRAIGSALSTSIFELSVFPSLFFFHMIPLGYLFLFSSVFAFLGIIYVKFVIVPDVKKHREKHEMNAVA